jgi:hypothetical protein
VADLSVEPGIPEPFHRFCSMTAARIEVVAKSIQNKLQAIDTELQRMEPDIVAFFSGRDRDSKPRMGVKRTLEHY